MNNPDVNQKILVTGGTGFIGAYLIELLLAKGYNNIRALKRPESAMGLANAFANRVEWVNADVRDVANLALAIKGVQKVYHCAAVISFSGANARLMKEVNVDGTANVVNLALEEGVEKLLHVSSIAALGNPKHSEVVTEESKWEPGNVGTIYGLTKHLAEMEVWRAKAEGLKVVVVNPSNVLGSGFWKERTSTGQLFFKIWQGLKFYPVGATGWVDVRDVADFMVKLMEREVAGERYILSAENRDFKDVFHRIAEAVKKPPPSVKASFFLREMAWRAAWIQSKLTGSEPIITKETARTSATTKSYSNTKSLSVFDDFRYRSVNQTLEEMAAQFLEASKNGFLPLMLPFK